MNRRECDEELAELRAERDSLLAALRALHQKVAPAVDGGASWCLECETAWPCKTAALGELEGKP